MAPVLQALTANRLRDGAVVYWQAGRWVEALAGAEVLAAKDAADAALAAAAKAVADRVVVSPYLFAVTQDDGVLVPVSEREIVRAAGPSVRTDLGKQALEDDSGAFDVSI